MDRWAFILLLTGSSFAYGQNTFSQTLYWLRYQNQLFFNKDFYWTNEADNRRFIGPDVQSQLILHSRLHKREGAWDFAAGATASFAYAQRPEIGYQHSVTELRPVGEVSHEVKLKRLSLLNRVRIDNRFFEVDESTSIIEESRYVLRIRHRLQARMDLLNGDGKLIGNIRLAEELMVNSRQNLFDQFRLYATTDWIISKNLSVETGYIYVYQQRFAAQEFFERHVLRFSLLHKISL